MKRKIIAVGGLILLGIYGPAGAEDGPILNPADRPVFSRPAPEEMLPDDKMPVERLPVANDPPPSMIPQSMIPQSMIPQSTIPPSVVPPGKAQAETIQPGAMDAANSPPGPNSLPSERWRYKLHHGRWWYFTPDQRWFYWNKTDWREAPPGLQPYNGVSSSNVPSFGPPISYRQTVGINPDLIPVWRGPPPQYGPPPFPGMPRYRGEPYLFYYGRLYRIQGAYANGFQTFSGPPAGSYWSGNGRVGFPGYNNW